MLSWHQQATGANEPLRRMSGSHRAPAHLSLRKHVVLGVLVIVVGASPAFAREKLSCGGPDFSTRSPS